MLCFQIPLEALVNSPRFQASGGKKSTWDGHAPSPVCGHMFFHLFLLHFILAPNLVRSLFGTNRQEIMNGLDLEQIYLHFDALWKCNNLGPIFTGCYDRFLSLVLAWI